MGDEKKLGVFINSRLGRGGFDDLDKAVKGSEAQAKKSAQGMSGDYQAAFEKIRNAAAIAFAGITAGIGFAVKESMEGERATLKLASSVKSAGGDWDVFGGKVDSATMRLQRLTGFADDEYQGALSRMIDISHDYEGALANLPLVADLAVARELDLAQAGDMVARAMAGEIGMLARMIPGLDEQIKVLGETATAGDRARVIFANLATFQGRAEAAAKSHAGQLKIATEEVKSAAEEIGNVFSPTVVDAANKIKETAKEVGEWTKKHPELTLALGKTALAVTGITATLFTFVTVWPKVVAGFGAIRLAMLSLVNDPKILLISAAIAAIGGGVGYILSAASSTARLHTELTALSVELGVSVDSLQAMRNEISGLDAWNRDYEEKWQATIATMRAAKAPLADVATGLDGISVAATKAAEKVSIDAAAFRDLMNAGLGVAEAMRLAQGAVLPEQVVETTSPGARLDLELTMRQANNAAQLADDKKAAAERIAIWEAEVASKRELFSSLENAYRVGVESIVNSEMTGKQRREAIWNAFKMSSIRMIADVTAKYLFGELAKKAASIITTAAAVTGAATETVAQVAAAKLQGAAWIKVAYAKQLAFYSWLGPAAPAAAAGTITASIAAMQAAGAAAAGGFQQGGIVPGYGFGDRVPIWAESGERIIAREKYIARAPAIERAIEGKGGGGNTFQITVPVQGKGSYGDALNFRRMLEDVLPSALEELLERRAIRGLPA